MRRDDVGQKNQYASIRRRPCVDATEVSGVMTYPYRRALATHASVVAHTPLSQLMRHSPFGVDPSHTCSLGAVH